jgi:hypothetical protein
LLFPGAHPAQSESVVQEDGQNPARRFGARVVASSSVALDADVDDSAAPGVIEPLDELVLGVPEETSPPLQATSVMVATPASTLPAKVISRKRGFRRMAARRSNPRARALQ